MNEVIQAHIRAFFGNQFDDGEPPFTRYFALSGDLAMNIEVVISTENDRLQLSYFVNQNDSQAVGVMLDTPATPSRADFLWEGTCFECFFDTGNSDYFELNFAPNGKYNLYHFDDYRTPDTLPPPKADGELALVDGGVDGLTSYHLDLTIKNISAMDIVGINPVAIIKTDAPHFFAVKHATPADFHNKEFWQEL